MSDDNIVENTSDAERVENPNRTEMTQEEAVRKISEIKSEIHSLYEKMCKLAEQHGVELYFSGIYNTSYYPEEQEWNHSSRICY